MLDISLPIQKCVILHVVKALFLENYFLLTSFISRVRLVFRKVF